MTKQNKLQELRARAVADISSAADDDFVFQTSEPTADAEHTQLGKIEWEDIRVYDTPTMLDGDGLDYLGTYQPDVDATGAGVSSPTGNFQAMLGQANNDFDGDGKDDLGTYQPDTFQQVVRKDYFAVGTDAGTLARGADAAAPGVPHVSAYFDDFSLTVVGVSSDQEFFLI